MRHFATAAALLILFGATACAGDQSVSGSTLENMGLGGMKQLTDTEGNAVRGRGLLDGFLGLALSGVDGAINDSLNGTGVTSNFNISGTVLDQLNSSGGLGNFDLGGFGGFGGTGGFGSFDFSSFGF
jgi:hypothetical protein